MNIVFTNEFLVVIIVNFLLLYFIYYSLVIVCHFWSLLSPLLTFDTAKLGRL